MPTLPDGWLYLDLHGYDPDQPLASAEGLAELSGSQHCLERGPASGIARLGAGHMRGGQLVSPATSSTARSSSSWVL